MKKYYIRNTLSITLIVLSLISIWISIVGCAQLRPGADPIVVRAEQTEAAAKSTFDLILSVDHADRGFWRSNSPAFHAYCEWLRTPQIVFVTNVMPRASAMIVSLNNVKHEYLLSKVYSNALVSAIAVLEAANVEAGAWAGVITNKTVK
jgi:hypothetical protein